MLLFTLPVSKFKTKIETLFILCVSGLRGYVFRSEALLEQLQQMWRELCQAVHLPGSRQQLIENDEDIVSAAAQGEKEKVESILERNRSAVSVLAGH